MSFQLRSRAAPAQPVDETTAILQNLEWTVDRDGVIAAPPLRASLALKACVTPRNWKKLLRRTCIILFGLILTPLWLFVPLLVMDFLPDMCTYTKTDHIWNPPDCRYHYAFRWQKLEICIQILHVLGLVQMIWAAPSKVYDLKDSISYQFAGVTPANRSRQIYFLHRLADRHQSWFESPHLQTSNARGTALWKMDLYVWSGVLLIAMDGVICVFLWGWDMVERPWWGIFSTSIVVAFATLARNYVVAKPTDGNLEQGDEEKEQEVLRQIIREAHGTREERVRQIIKAWNNALFVQTQESIDAWFGDWLDFFNVLLAIMWIMAVLSNIFNRPMQQ